MVSRTTVWLIVIFATYVTLREVVLPRHRARAVQRTSQSIQLILSDGKPPGDPLADRAKSCLERVHQPWFCPAELIDQQFIKDVGMNFPYPSHLSAQRGEPRGDKVEQLAIMRQLYWWCDKFPPDVTAYPVERAELSAQDIGIGVFTGLDILYSRGITARDTWMTQFPNSYFFLEDTHETFPVVGLKQAYPEHFKGGVGETAMWALKYLYDHNPDLKWYNVVGCDSWIDADVIVQMLSEYQDESKPVWLVYSIYERDVLHNGMYAKSLAKHIPHYNDTWVYGRDKTPQVHAWTSGGLGFWVNNAVAKAYSEGMLRWRSFTPGDTFGYAPDVDTGAMLTLMGFTPTEVSPQWFRRMDAVAADVDEGGMAKMRLAKNVAQLHFIKPWSGLNLNQQRDHQKIDRLVNAGDTQRVLQYFHDYVDVHYEVMRRRLRDIRTVLTKAPDKPQKWGDMVMTERSLSDPTADDMEKKIQERRAKLQSLAEKRKKFGPRSA